MRVTPPLKTADEVVGWLPPNHFVCSLQCVLNRVSKHPCNLPPAPLPQVFKGLTAVLKLLVAVDPDVAAHMGSLTALLPLLSLSYMLISKNRHRLAPLWTAIVRTTKAGAGRAGGRVRSRP